MGTVMAVYLPMVHALKKGREYLSAKKDWKPVSAEQEDFLEYARQAENKLNLFSDKELAGIASNSAREVNDFLRRRGFDIQMEQPDRGVVMASALEVFLKWLHAGKCVKMISEGKKYDGAELNQGFDILYARGGENFVARISTKKGDKVYMMPSSPVCPEDLVQEIERIRVDMGTGFYPQVYADILRFPMVSTDVRPDIDWIRGLFIDSPKYGIQEITEAKQQVILRLNEQGMDMKSAVALGTRGEKKVFEIDKPFILWAERRGVAAHPAVWLYAYIDRTDWKDPGRE